MRQPAARPALAVPFLDLRPSDAPLKEELLEAVSELVDSNAYTNGPDVALFENAFASYCGTREAIGVASGLDALRLALLACGIGPGDEVIVPALTFVATLEAVTQAGAQPVVVDVSASDYCIDPPAVEAASGRGARFLVPVHLYGQLADMGRLADDATREGLLVVEDACQAHGAERDGLRAGATGVAGCFSFYPGKNLGAMGDAGAVTTSDPELARRVRALREHGQTAKYVHELEGWTSRLDTIQALVLRRKLELLDGWNTQRRAAARYYREHLAGVGDLGLPSVLGGRAPVWHLFVVTTADPDGLAGFLADRRIASARHYPQPVHLTTAYAHLGYRTGDFPVAEAVARECLSLPIFPGITEAQLGAVVEGVQAFFNG